MSSHTRILGGRYEVGELIGHGGMADVHLGHDTRLGRQVAIKMLRSDLARDPSFLMRFRREAQSAAGLNHPSIVAIFDSGEEETLEPGSDGRVSRLPYMVMEHVDGQTLREQLTERGQFEPTEALRVTEGILDALDYSHRMGIVHRDIKPANVMMTREGVVKVMDFGIARAIADTAATMTQTQSVVGTAQYLSPEQAQGQVVDARSDIYSTGCLLFELLAGRPPFQGDSPVAIAYQHVGETPQPPSIFNDAVAGDLDAVTLHALTKDRERRYQDAGSFRRDLENVRLGRPISDAALGTADAVGAAPTQTMPAPYAQAGAPTVVQPSLAAGAAGAAGAARWENTAGMPAVGREEEPEERRGRGGKIALITALVLGLLALAGWGGVTLLGNQTPEVAQVSVPDLRGMAEQTAARTLTERKLRGEATKVASADVDAGDVVEQNPGANAVVAENSVVEYQVSTGPDSVSVPAVAGQKQDAAQKLLTDAGLSVKEVQEENTPDQAKGVATKTDPAAGETVGKGAEVTLFVATGNVQVPDNLVDQDFSVAAVQLNDLKLKYSRVEKEAADTAAGTVLEVANAGKVVPVGSTIEVTVAAAPTTPPTTVTTTVTAPPETPTETPTSSDTPSETPSSTTTTPPPSTDTPTTPPPAADPTGQQGGSGGQGGEQAVDEPSPTPSLGRTTDPQGDDEQ
ncbi:serine/threonine-protein kinase [Terracoccus luteus]|uniref:non-specific serine/threonine protein kinase n=1 Tax=Terracoccus luteus TaxID=53356 RepID=A0A495XYK1_9MICO|nr:Stk1 family PASTA domain-containing Ser/Thr kinase [Terracoccus luteus]RKT79691.1 serine/threonine-protein kinase [Terracoccus luteus]